MNSYQVGIDEVGRGCLAGPLVIGAVILKAPIPGLKDSKLLSKKRRNELNEVIYNEAAAATLGWVWPHEIDLLGLTNATALAINRALDLINIEYQSILIDGSVNYLKTNAKAKTMVKADNLVPEVSAASIIAKVARDNYMQEIAQYFPNYSFDEHVGYGTALHLNAISNFGPCVIHRLSFKPLSKTT